MPPVSVPAAGHIAVCETKQRLVLVSQQRMPPPGTAPHAEVHWESLPHAIEHVPESVRGGPMSRGAGPMSRGGGGPMSGVPPPVSGRPPPLSGIITIPMSVRLGPVSVGCVVRPELQPMLATQSRSEAVTTEMLASFMAVW